MTEYDNDYPLKIEQQAFLSQRKQFWTLQLIGWIAYFIVVFAVIIRPQFEDPSFNFYAQLMNLCAETLCGFALSYFQWFLIGKFVHLRLSSILTLSFISAAVLGFIYNVLKLSFYKVIVYDQQWNEAWNMLEFGGWLLFSVATMFVWTSIYFIMLYNAKLQKEHEMLLRAQTAAKEAQLQMLRYQLNPHFMFNTMNAISTLIYKQDNEKAIEMVDKLCAFFRYSLAPNAAKQSTMKKELELIELYLSIEKVRFGHRLMIDVDVSKEAMHAKVPSLFLQPIVENAVKYGIESRKEGGSIQLSAIVKAQRLLVTINNDCEQSRVNKEPGFGIGLNNTQERLTTMFNNDCSLTVTYVDHETQVTIDIPYIK